MAKELSEESKFQISVKTLIGIGVGIATVVSAYFGLMGSINSKFVDLEDKVETLDPCSTLRIASPLSTSIVFAMFKASISNLIISN